MSQRSARGSQLSFCRSVVVDAWLILARRNMTLWTVSILGFLYSLQGMPYGIQVKFLPILLRANGVSLTNISLFKLLFLPWVLKLVWTPFVDKHGTRKQWLTSTLLLMSLTCLLTSFVDVTNVALLALMLFIQNICLSVQDISVDALAVAVLASDDVGLGNVAQVVGYKLGGVVGGGSYMMLYNTFGSGVVYLIMSFFYLSALFAVCSLDIGAMQTSTKSGNPPQTKKKKEKQMGDNKESSYLSSLTEAFRVEGTPWMIIYTALYKCGENGTISILPLYLVDAGTSNTRVAFYTGIMGSFTTIAGSLLGGALLKKYSVSRCSHLLNLLRLFIMVLIAAMTVSSILSDALLSYKTDILLILCCSQLFLSGVSSILTFSWMMHLSQNAPKTIQMTHYTMLATSEILGKLMFGSVVGSIADKFGYDLTFLFLLVMVFLATVMTSSQPQKIKMLGS